MSDKRRNLQSTQDGVQGYKVADGIGWPVPLTDPSNPLKLKVTNGSSGETRNFRAMSTSGQSDISKPEGDGGGGKGANSFDGELSVKVKKTVSDSTK